MIKDIREQVRDLRYARKWSLEQMALAADCSVSNISRWLGGQDMPIERLEMMLRNLDVMLVAVPMPEDK